MFSSKSVKAAIILVYAACSLSSSPVFAGDAGSASAKALTVSEAAPQVSEVTEAAFAYGERYAESIKASLAAGHYVEAAALKHLNAESCLDSRAYRLLNKEISREDKDALVLKHVSKADFDAYQVLASGYFPRPNGLEMFSCRHAGLSVASKAVH